MAAPSDVQLSDATPLDELSLLSKTESTASLFEEFSVLRPRGMRGTVVMDDTSLAEESTAEPQWLSRAYSSVVELHHHPEPLGQESAQRPHSKEPPDGWIDAALRPFRTPDEPAWLHDAGEEVLPSATHLDRHKRPIVVGLLLLVVAFLLLIPHDLMRPFRAPAASLAPVAHSPLRPYVTAGQKRECRVRRGLWTAVSGAGCGAVVGLGVGVPLVLGAPAAAPLILLQCAGGVLGSALSVPLCSAGV